MPKVPEFSVAVTINALGAPQESKHCTLIIHAYSINHAWRRVLAGLNLIDEIKEGADEPEGDPDGKGS